MRHTVQALPSILRDQHWPNLRLLGTFRCADPQHRMCSRAKLKACSANKGERTGPGLRSLVVRLEWPARPCHLQSGLAAQHLPKAQRQRRLSCCPGRAAASTPMSSSRWALDTGTASHTERTILSRGSVPVSCPADTVHNKTSARTPPAQLSDHARITWWETSARIVRFTCWL